LLAVLLTCRNYAIAWCVRASVLLILGHHDLFSSPQLSGVKGYYDSR